MICLGFTGGCSNLGYYTQSIRGQFDLLWKREAISDLIQHPGTPANLKDKLTRVLQLREFASQTLLLPENGSYRSYADLHREHVVWTVYATPEFSLELRTWCFPFAGCVSYRGHFSPEAAEEFAAPLRAQGDDVYVGGVDAYSTLGWFDDPVLNTFIHRSEPALAGLIFHELAHQRLYVKNDTTFNESFARTVELEGVRLWLQSHGTPAQLDDYTRNETRRDEFVAVINRARDQLRTLYAADLAAELKRTQKQLLFEQIKTGYAQLKQRWGGYAGYDAWFATQLNNAKLASVTTYADDVPAFQALLKQKHYDFAAFYAAAKTLGDLAENERRIGLKKLVE
ncbi:MAG: aminopeptidase [Gammaproteobacteria bacterium]|nr:aminopeptidase [Gammaproteobacteria bacterium]